MSFYDIIIIGGGINSLTAAAKLGKSGKKVVVFESRENFGGIGDTSEFVNGFKCNSLNDSISWLDPRMEKEFALSSYGLKIFQPDLGWCRYLLLCNQRGENPHKKEEPPLLFF